MTLAATGEQTNPARRRSCPPGPFLAPADFHAHLDALLGGARLSGRAWRVVLTVLLAPEPVTSRDVARRTGIDYQHAKRLIRRLIALPND